MYTKFYKSRKSSTDLFSSSMRLPVVKLFFSIHYRVTFLLLKLIKPTASFSVRPVWCLKHTSISAGFFLPNI